LSLVQDFILRNY